jgi:DNA mismatch repair protein MSH3
LIAFNKIAGTFSSVQSAADVGFKSTILNNIIASLPKLREPLQQVIDAVSLKKAAEGNKVEMWSDQERYPDIADADTVSVLIAPFALLLNG